MPNNFINSQVSPQYYPDSSKANYKGKHPNGGKSLGVYKASSGKHLGLYPKAKGKHMNLSRSSV